MIPLVKYFYDRRWPLGVVALLGFAVIANLTLAMIATGPGAQKPIEGYYGKALNWDKTQKLERTFADAGLKVAVELPQGPQYVRGMLRPVDLAIRDDKGKAVAGLKGRIEALRSSDANLNNGGDLVEVPGDPGKYRVLLQFAADGLWRLEADLKKGETEYAFSLKVDVSQSRDLRPPRETPAGEAR